MRAIGVDMTNSRAEDHGHAADHLHACQWRPGVVGNAAALTAQRIDVAGATPILIGMNRAGVDNQQFALNIIHWLIGMIE